MKAFHEGQLVTLVAEGSELDAIVVHAPSLVKVEVAVVDDERGAVFRTVHPKTLRERSAAGEHDDALRRRIRRTPSADRAGPRNGPGRGRRGHSHVSGHRTTGK
jgi:phage-related baseplate assembly protein